ncbi:MAG: molybdopterin-binding protein [Pseudorhodobacter sp.]|nr:molybdopterin-binding protein [Pseudorhodobacter sp.]
MQFGPVPLDAAIGAILAHSVALPEGRLRKGKWLTAADIAALRAAGLAQVTVARLDATDLHEDAAAARIAAALVPDPVGQGLRLGPAATGRVNIFATGPGLAQINAAAIRALNRVNPMITLATVAPWQRLQAGDMLATVKIIAYGLPAADVSRAERAGTAALALARPAFASASLIETTTTGALPALKGREALRTRLTRLGLGLGARVVVAHSVAALAGAIAAAPGEVIFILAASATSDPCDVAPEGLRRAGGQVQHFGLPVDPGNLLFFGSLGNRPVIGLPGCARSPVMNGADWVLERLICAVPLTDDDIAAMGVGGLLKEIPIRPRPRET